ncbi:MAG: aspartate kinase [Candidatus Geothermarchaeales archaeon]
MNTTVLKIGGSCLRDGKDVLRIIDIVREQEKAVGKPILVISAFSGVTDQLISLARNAFSGRFDLGEIEGRHYGLIEHLSSSTKRRVGERLGSLLAELEKSLLSLGHIKDLSPEALDGVISYGEKLAIEIVAAHLVDAGFRAVALSDSDAGIITNSNFGNASILRESVDLIREKLAATPIPVVAGFIGRDVEGRMTTLGRGGSDYTATFIASSLTCGVSLLKDVGGLMTADPKMVAEASVIKQINYLDALEMAHYGSKVINEKAIIPAMESRIPINVSNFYEFSSGTTISSEGEATAISTLEDVARIAFLGRPASVMKAVASLLTELCTRGIHPLLMAKASRGETYFIFDGAKVGIIEGIIQESIVDSGVEVGIKDALGLVTAVGSGVEKKREGVASTIKLLWDKGARVHGVHQPTSGRSLCVTVDGGDVRVATQAMHGIFVGP